MALHLERWKCPQTLAVSSQRLAARAGGTWWLCQTTPFQALEVSEKWLLFRGGVEVDSLYFQAADCFQAGGKA